MEEITNTPSSFSSSADSGRRPANTAFFVLIIVTSLLFGGAGGALMTRFLAGEPTGPSGVLNNRQISLTEDSAIIDVVKQAGPAVVSIVISKDLSRLPGYGLSPYNDPFFNFFYGAEPEASGPNIQEVGAGSGFFVSSDGLILTNRHVVEDEEASYTVLTSDGKKLDAQVLARDPVNDLAIVKVDIQNAPLLAMSDSSSLQVGQRVIAIGNSLGQYQNTVTSGIISGIGREITAGSETGGSELLSGVIQTDAAINPGNSGGPLLDVTGKVIGINTAIDQEGQLVGFAIPSNEASKALDSFTQKGKITRPYLGVRYVMIGPDIAAERSLPLDYGALIIRGSTASTPAVIVGSPADQAGLKENDIIEEIEGERIDEENTLSRALNKHNTGDRLTLKIYRDGRELTLHVILGETE